MLFFCLRAVHRLNVELSRYQAKYRPVSFEVYSIITRTLSDFTVKIQIKNVYFLLQEVEGLALPYKKEAAPWLVGVDNYIEFMV